MSNDGNFCQGFNSIERDRDFFAPEELFVPDSALDDSSSAHQIKKLDSGVEAAHIDLEDKNTYAHVQLIPSLEDMATLAATLETLHYYYSENFYDYLADVNKVIDNLMVPDHIREKMTALCAEMKKELCSLRFGAGSRGLDRPILRLRDVYDNDSYFYVYGLVWDSNGHIDDKKTIEKALSYSGRSNNNGDSIFQIITKYCLVNHIMNFPLDSLSKEFISRSMEGDQLTRYWITYKKITLGILHVASYESALIGLLNSLRPFCGNKYQWSAYEYFWDFMNENGQTEIAMSLIRDENYKRYQKVLFSMLNKNQLKRLYSVAPLIIIVNFVCLGELELAKAVWDRIKLTIQCEEYEVLLEEIWKKEIPDEESCMQFSIYSWNTARSNIIEYMIHVKKCQTMTKIMYGEPMLESSCRFKFLKAVLSRTTPEFSRRYLQHAGPYLSLNHPDVFSSLMDHCFNETDSVTFKENILIQEMESNRPAGIMHRFRDLVYSNREEFNKFLELFTLKPKLQTRFKECLLQSNLLITKVLWNAENWQKLSQFIDDLYPNRDVARYQKRKVVFTFSRTHCSYHDCYRPNGDEKFTEIDNILTQVLTPREVITAKENIGDRFLKTCQSGGVRSLKRMNLQRFATWCYCGDENNIKRFRRSLPIDKLFRYLLSQVVNRYVNGRDARLSFSSLDELIRWKFSSSRSEMKNFKSREIYGIMKEQVEEDFKWKTYKYPAIVKKVIEWVFDGDRRQIREFEQRYSKSDRMKIIHWMYLSEETTDCAEYYYHTSDESDSGRRTRRNSHGPPMCFMDLMMKTIERANSGFKKEKIGTSIFSSGMCSDGPSEPPKKSRLSYPWRKIF
ncbi:uncharacterized protein LOC135841482 [Planococcus citri]|uniref:uncharacterized protein LOC135841482 n=1 Tax=Planococcus citri TaxID=170843 RepID=UPI0031F8C00D